MIFLVLRRASPRNQPVRPEYVVKVGNMTVNGIRSRETGRLIHYLTLASVRGGVEPKIQGPLMPSEMHVVTTASSVDRTLWGPQRSEYSALEAEGSRHRFPHGLVIPSPDDVSQHFAGGFRGCIERIHFQRRTYRS